MAAGPKHKYEDSHASIIFALDFRQMPWSDWRFCQHNI